MGTSCHRPFVNFDLLVTNCYLMLINIYLVTRCIICTALYFEDNITMLMNSGAGLRQIKDVLQGNPAK